MYSARQGSAVALVVIRRLLTSGGPGSRQGQFMRDLWWTEWRWDGYFSESFGFVLQLSFQYHFIIWEMDDGALASQFHTIVVSPHRNKWRKLILCTCGCRGLDRNTRVLRIHWWPFRGFPRQYIWQVSQLDNRKRHGGDGHRMLRKLIKTRKDSDRLCKLLWSTRTVLHECCQLFPCISSCLLDTMKFPLLRPNKKAQHWCV